MSDQAVPGAPPEEIKYCPACAEPIKAAAILCRYCGYDFRTGAVPTPGATPPVPTVPPDPASSWSVPAPVQPASVEAPARKTNGLAIASMVLGIVWLYGIGSILALVFGYIAKGQIDRSGGRETGRGMAIAGIILGWIGVGFLVLVIVLVASTGSSSQYSP